MYPIAQLHSFYLDIFSEPVYKLEIFPIGITITFHFLGLLTLDFSFLFTIRYLNIILIFAASICTVTGFATDICSHDELVEKSRDAFECGKKFDAKVFGNARNNSGNVQFCQIVKDR